jgi:hypothetical protein
VARVSVDSTFVRKPFDRFKDEYLMAKCHVHRLRQVMTAGTNFYVTDLTNPTPYLLIACFRYLELVVQFVCSCIPSDGIVDNVRVAKQVKILVHCLQGLFDCADIGISTSELVSSFHAKKRIFKERRRTLVGGRSRISEKAYTSTEPQIEHFIALTGFAVQLARVCRVMYRESRKTWSIQDQENFRFANIVVSHKYLVVHVPEPAPIRELELRCKAHKDGIEGAFKAWNELALSGNGIHVEGLSKQKNHDAIILYTLLWHVLTMWGSAMSPKTRETIKRKLFNLDDERCLKYRSRNSGNIQYVFEPLKAFWDSSSKSYDAKCAVVKCFDISKKDEVEKFCLALTRNVAACTPVSGKRKPTLIAWMHIVRETTHSCGF